MERAPHIDSNIEQPKFLPKIETFSPDVSRQMKGIVALLSDVEFDSRERVTEENIASVLNKYPQRASFEDVGMKVVKFIGQKNGEQKAEKYRTSLALLADVLYEDQSPKSPEEAPASKEELENIKPHAAGMPENIDSVAEQPKFLPKIETFSPDVSRQMKGIVAGLSGVEFDSRERVTEENIASVLNKYRNYNIFQNAVLKMIKDHIAPSSSPAKVEEYIKAMKLLTGVLYEKQIFEKLTKHFLDILISMKEHGKHMPKTTDGHIGSGVFESPLFIELYKDGPFFKDINYNFFGNVLKDGTKIDVQEKILLAQNQALENFDPR